MDCLRLVEQTFCGLLSVMANSKESFLGDLGAAEPQDRGTSPRAPARRGLTPLQPPQGRACGGWMVG